MSLLDNLSDKFRDELENLAKSHPTFGTFTQDLERLAETTWHKVRGQGIADAEQAGQQLEEDAVGAGDPVSGDPVSSLEPDPAPKTPAAS